MVTLKLQKSIPNIDSQIDKQPSEDFLEGFADFWVSFRAKKDNSQAQQKILKPENEKYLQGWLTAWGLSEGILGKSELLDFANSGYENGYKSGKELRKFLSIKHNLIEE